MNEKTRPLLTPDLNSKFRNPRAEEIRIKSHYRSLAMIAGITAPVEALRGLIGPDCAYCLYKNIPSKNTTSAD